jgi:hypothetical protein
MIRVILAAGLLCPLGAAWAASEKIPVLDVTKTCEAAQKAQDGIPDKFKKCMADEDNAKATLATAWPAARVSTRDTCEGEAKDGPFPSYADMLSCVQMFEAGIPRPKK